VGDHAPRELAGLVDEMRVFGSVARGTASKDSDIDLLIDFVGPPPDDFDY